MYFTIQLPHTYKEGTDISPHVHWSPINTNAGTVKWFLEYTVATINGTFSTPTTISISDPSDLTTWKQQVIGFPDISGTGLTISSMLVCRLYRDPADAEDTYNSDAGLLQMDFHYQIDSIGSTSPFTK